MRAKVYRASRAPYRTVEFPDSQFKLVETVARQAQLTAHI